MANDFQNKLGAILNNPEMLKTIASMADSIGNGNAESGIQDEGSSGISDRSAGEIASELQSVMSSINSASDSRINLLMALKPYMRTNRAENMDTAIKILKLTKLTSLLKDI